MTLSTWKSLTLLVLGISLMIVASLPWLNIEEVRVIGLVVTGFGAVSVVKNLWN